MKLTIAILGATIAAVICVAPDTVARADGGRLCANELAGPWRVTVFAARASLGTGLTDFSVIVQQADTGALQADATVTIEARHSESSEVVTSGASTDAATNKLFKSAACDLSAKGTWHVTVTVARSGQDSHAVDFELEIANWAPTWADEAYWIGWPIVPISLFVIHQFLVRRKSTYESAT